MAGIKENIPKGWEALKATGLKLDEPTPLGKYLGCGQIDVKTNVATLEEQNRNYGQIFINLRAPIVTATDDESGKPVEQPPQSAKSKAKAKSKSKKDVHVPMPMSTDGDASSAEAPKPGRKNKKTVGDPIVGARSVNVHLDSDTGSETLMWDGLRANPFR